MDLIYIPLRMQGVNSYLPACKPDEVLFSTLLRDNIVSARICVVDWYGSFIYSLATMQQMEEAGQEWGRQTGEESECCRLHALDCDLYSLSLSNDLDWSLHNKNGMRTETFTMPLGYNNSRLTSEPELHRHTGGVLT